MTARPDECPECQSGGHEKRATRDCPIRWELARPYPAELNGFIGLEDE